MVCNDSSTGSVGSTMPSIADHFNPLDVPAVEALQEVSLHRFWHTDAADEPRARRMDHVFGRRESDRAQQIVVAMEGVVFSVNSS